MVRPKKYLGQHFLTDENIARKIVSIIPGKTKNLLEIGPGKGILTKFILQRSIPGYYMIEIDPESVGYIQEHFPQIKDRIIQADFLSFDPDTIYSEPFSVIGNFPYNISSQILFRILEYRNRVENITGMLQKEVAERIASEPGSKKYGILSVLIGAYYDIRLHFTVNENVFYPPPKIKSAVIELTRNRTPHLDCNEKLFFTVVKTAFNQRRKTLRNALKSLGSDLIDDRDYLRDRAEQLSVKKFIHLTNLIEEARSNK